MVNRQVDWAVAVVSGIVVMILLHAAGSGWDMILLCVIAFILYDNEANQWATTSPSSPHPLS